LNRRTQQKDHIVDIVDYVHGKHRFQYADTF